MKSVAIVGASLAGIRAAQTLRGDGFEGRITLIGDEPHRPYDRPPLSKSALAGEMTGKLAGELAGSAKESTGNESGKSGQPELDEAALQEALTIVGPEDYDGLNLDERLGAEAVRLELGGGADGKSHAVFIRPADDSGVGDIGGGGEGADSPQDLGVEKTEKIEADAVLIATGASPRNLPNPENLRSIYTLRNLDDCLALYNEFSALGSGGASAGSGGSGPARKTGRVAVVGAGFIGCEVAATARQMGLEVALIEMASSPLEVVMGKETGEFIGEIHRENGVELLTNTKVEKFIGAPAGGGGGGSGARGGGQERAGRVAALQLKNRQTQNSTMLEADLVVVGIGVVPNTNWLEGSGLTLDDGIVCDETCLAAENVAAAGDIARWQNRRFNQLMRVEHWDNAIEQAKFAARRLLAGDDLRSVEPYAPIPWFWSDQYDLKIQLAGLASPTDELQIIEGSTAERKFTALYKRDGRTIGVLGVNSPRQVMQNRQKIEDDFPF